MVFYCTRCGARLQSPEAPSPAARVRCGCCSGVTRMPEPGHDLPVAPPAEPERFSEEFLHEVVGIAEVGQDAPADGFPSPAEADAADWAVSGQAYVPFAQAVSLDYATPAVTGPPGLGGLDEMAEKLANVQVADGEPGAMVECPHCGSRITTYARKCSFCRHPLLGP